MGDNGASKTPGPWPQPASAVKPGGRPGRCPPHDFRRIPWYAPRPDMLKRLLPDGVVPVLKKLPSFLIALMASIGFGVSYGFNYGSDNQTAYFLGSLRLTDPALLTRDWYAQGPANYHPIFAYVGYVLLRFSHIGWGVGVAMVLTAIVGAMCMYRLLLDLVEPRVALPAFVLLACLMTLTRTSSVAASYVFSWIIQPSTVSSMLLLLAIPPFVRGKWLASGVWLGLAGLFHANFLVLGIATFGFSHLLLGRKELPRRLALQLGASLVAGLILAPLMLRSTASPDAARAQDILFTIRSPHHYAPKTYEHAFFPFAAWQMVGFGAGGWLLRGRNERGTRLGMLVVSMAVLVWSGTLLTTAIYIPRVAQVFVWRYAPFLELLAQMLACATAARIAIEPSFVRRIPRGGLALTLGGAVLLLMLEANQGGPVVTPIVLAILGLPVVFLLAAVAGHGLSRVPALVRPLAAVGRKGHFVVFAAALLVGGLIGRSYFKAHPVRTNLAVSSGGAEAELYAWIHASTPKDAIFITPPGMERFRLLGERAIIVDWKGSPIAPGDMLEWYRRLEDVSGRRGFHGGGEVTSGYDAMDPARLEMLKDRYNASFAVISRSRAGAFEAYKTVYQNGQYKVLKLD